MRNFHFIKVILVFFECCFIATHAQNILFRHDDEDSDLMERNFIEAVEIPENLLIRMKDIRNITQLASRFLLTNLTFSSVPFNSTASLNGRNALSGEPRASAPFAQPAACQPEEQIVELEKPASNAVMLWPSCVRVRRCGGCCTSKLLSCNPVATSTVDVIALQIRYNPENPNAFENQGSRVITLEQHDRCTCGCREKPEDCTPNVHEYVEEECKCICINQKLSLSCTGPKKYWDTKKCACKCKNRRQCSTGAIYNLQKCKCEALRNSLIALNLDRTNATNSSAIRFEN